jgi:hypothetical protein
MPKEAGSPLARLRDPYTGVEALEGAGGARVALGQTARGGKTNGIV